MYDIDYESGMVNIGDFARLKRAFAKAESKSPVCVGFIGGSITQGARSSTPETCYAYLVYLWWKEKFPETEIKYVNAGIGGTPSNFGVARVHDDLLKYNPDFAVVEFSVNDENTEHFKETYEGLVRCILKNSLNTGLMLVHNVQYDSMVSAEPVHLLIGKHYDIPCVSMKSSVYPKVASGEIPAREITPDDLHPNDAGHRLLANLIIHMLEKAYETYESEKPESSEAAGDVLAPKPSEAAGDFLLPDPITENGFEYSMRLNNTNCVPMICGFEKDETVQNHITEMFRHGYTAAHKGDKIEFKAFCSSVAVQFRKSVNKPTLIGRVIIDGDESSAKILDGNFDEDWGDCLYTETVAAHMELREHSILIEIIKDHPEDVVPFYLVSVIASR